MDRTRAYINIVFFFLLSQTSIADTFTSDTQQTNLIELYTSQGCSSCPPAEQWISHLENHDELWTRYVPVVFHVDYWNYLGWKDTFSKPEYSQRQRQYHAQGNISSVYTPGLLFNGKEWRSWFVKKPLPVSNNQPGVLVINFDGTRLKAKYQHARPMILNIALLGFDVLTHVTSGENESRILNSNFIVLEHIQTISDTANWEIPLTSPIHTDNKKYAIAAWINEANSLTPVQATGGWLRD